MWFVFIARILRNSCIFMWLNTESISFKHLKRIVTFGFQKAKQILRNVHLEMQNLPDVTPNPAALPFHIT